MTARSWLSGNLQVTTGASDFAPLAGGACYFYDPGTTNAKDTYTESDLAVANTNPVILDANGRPPTGIWLSGDYDVAVYTDVIADGGTLVFSEDNINPDETAAATRFKGHITGLVPAIDPTDTDHDILISTGSCVDAGTSAFLTLSAAITKQIDATWAAGDDVGGLFSGTVANSTWYHVFLIRNPNTDTVDAGFDTSASAANAPSGYTQYRRLGSVLTDGSANITGFSCREMAGGGLQFLWDDPVSDLISHDGTRQLVTLNVPIDYVTEAFGPLVIRDTTPDTSRYFIVTDSNVDDFAPSLAQGANIASINLATGQTATESSGWWQATTDTASRIATRSSASDGDFDPYVVLYGWMDARR